MSALNKLQRIMLRGWAINMTLALRYSRPRRLGFDYTSAEEARFRAIAENVSPAALAVWLGASVTLYLLVFVSVLLVVATQFPSLPFVLLFCAIILIALIALPCAMGASAAITDLCFRIPPFKGAEGDAELLAKIGWQFVLVAVTAAVAAIVITYVQAAFYSPAK
jgi:hypothetical protein